jgi:hypothetical protein
MDPETEEDFMISLPVAQKIAFHVSVYSNKDGVYIRANEIEDEMPMTIRVLENNYVQVYQEAFYFNDAYAFEGKNDYTYTIRFQNSNKHRLISLKLTPVLERSQV